MNDAWANLQARQSSFLHYSGKIVAIALFKWITATRVACHKHGVVASGDDAYSASPGTIIRFGFKRTALTAGLRRIIFKVERVTTANMRKLTQTNMENIVSIMTFWDE